MEHKDFTSANDQSNRDDKQQPSPKIQRDKVDEKLTLEEEADLTPEEVEQMEKKEADKGYKGSSGPEEKDIAV